MKQLFSGLVALSLFVSVAAQAKGDYLVTTIDVPGSALTQPLGINNAGQIVGAYRGSSGNLHGFLLSEGNYTTLDVPSPPGGAVGVGPTMATGITTSGLIVGWYEASSRPPPLPSDVGFLFSGGNYTSFNVSGPNIASTTRALGINDSMQIVGSVQRLVNGTFENTRQAFFLSGGSTTLFDPPGAVNSVASGINNAGQVVGHYQTAMGGPDHGFLLSNGVYTLLDVPGSLLTDANGINDLGQIVGQYRDASGQDHGFLYSDGTYSALDVPAAFSTDANAINDMGEIVGSYLATAGGSMHGFLATPAAAPVPEPSALLLLSIGTLCLLGWALRRWILSFLLGS